MSVGNATQAIDFNRQDLTLVLGENLDLGGDGSRNGTGKTTLIQTLVGDLTTQSQQLKALLDGSVDAPTLHRSLQQLVLVRPKFLRLWLSPLHLEAL